MNMLNVDRLELDYAAAAGYCRYLISAFEKLSVSSVKHLILG